MKQCITLLFSLFVALYIFSAHANGRAFSKNAGNTGAPGDEILGNGDPKTCTACHATSTTTTVALDLKIFHNGEQISEYRPGELHQVRLAIETLSGDPKRWGFQMVALQEGSWEDTDSWIDGPSVVRFALANSTGRRYAEHIIPMDTNVVVLDWEAPQQGTDSVYIFASGNGVDQSTTTGGDAAASTVLKIGEGLPLNISNNDFNWPLFYPTVTSGMIKSSVSYDGVCVFSGQGALLSCQNQCDHIDLSNYASGIYHLRIYQNKKFKLQSVVKR